MGHMENYLPMTYVTNEVVWAVALKGVLSALL